MPLTGPEHFRNAERLLSQASFVGAPEGPTSSLDPQVTALLLARAQVHATLAHAASWGADIVEAHDHDGSNEPCAACADQVAASDGARFEAMRRVVGGHLCEGLADPSREMRDFLRGLADELERAGVGVDDVVEETAKRIGYGPHRHSVDDTVYSLNHRYVDALGVVWEHTGNWNALHEPVMCTPDVRPALPLRAFGGAA
jgi:hypothetical protein